DGCFLPRVAQEFAGIKGRATIGELHDDGGFGVSGGRQRGVGAVRADHVDRRQRTLVLTTVVEELRQGISGDHSRLQFHRSHYSLDWVQRLLWRRSRARPRVESTVVGRMRYEKWGVQRTRRARAEPESSQ